MSRYRDNSGVANTCPLIDRVIGFIDSIDAEDVSTRSKTDTIDLLEEIRGMNSSIREWGNECYEEKENAEKELSDAQTKIENLEEELKFSEQQAKRLEEQNEALLDEIYKLKQMMS